MLEMPLCARMFHVEQLSRQVRGDAGVSLRKIVDSRRTQSTNILNVDQHLSTICSPILCAVSVVVPNTPLETP